MAGSRSRSNPPESWRRPASGEWRRCGDGSPAGIVDPFATMGPWPIPTLNTAILLSSGVTVTIAHHALIANHRGRAIFFMWCTVLLGMAFLGFQAYEYHHAYTELNLKLSSGAYGSTFFTNPARFRSINWR